MEEYQVDVRSQHMHDGEHAYYGAIPVEHNPYPPDSQDAEDWAWGWYNAAVEVVQAAIMSLLEHGPIPDTDVERQSRFTRLLTLWRSYQAACPSLEIGSQFKERGQAARWQLQALLGEETRGK